MDQPNGIMEYFPIAKRTRNQSSCTTTKTKKHCTAPTTHINIQGLPTSDPESSDDKKNKKVVPPAKPSARLAALKAKAKLSDPLPPRPTSVPVALRLKRPRVVLEEDDHQPPRPAPPRPSNLTLSPVRPCPAPISPQTPRRPSANVPTTPRRSDLPVPPESPRACAILKQTTYKPTSPATQSSSLTPGVSSLKSRLLALKARLNEHQKSPQKVTPLTDVLATPLSPRRHDNAVLPHLTDLYGPGPVTPIQSKLPHLASSPLSARRSIAPPLPRLDKVALPESLVHLLTIFQTLESMAAITLTRPDDPLILAKVERAIEIQSHREMSTDILGRLVGIFPEAYMLTHTRVRDVSGLDKVVDSVQIQINLEWDGTVDKVKESLLHRAVRFHQHDKPKRACELMRRCVALVDLKYQAWLAKAQLSWESTDDARWHPLFDVRKVHVDIPTATLPASAALTSPVRILDHPVHMQYQADRQAIATHVDTEMKQYMTTVPSGPLSVKQRLAILQAKVQLREQACSKLSLRTSEAVVRVSKLVHVAHVVLKYLQMEKRSVIELRKLADKVQTSLALMNKNACNQNRDAYDLICQVADLVPQVFEVMTVAGLTCLHKKPCPDAGSSDLDVVRAAVDQEKKRLLGPN